MSAAEPPIPSKPNFMTEMLAEFPSIDVHFRTNVGGIVFPYYRPDEPVQMLQYGLNMPRPILDLEIRPGGISATMSFSSKPHYTFIPWEAVFFIHVTGDMEAGYIWHDDQPASASPLSGLSAALAASGKIEAPRHLRLVPLGGPQEPPTEPRLTVNDFRVIRGGAE